MGNSRPQNKLVSLFGSLLYMDTADEVHQTYIVPDNRSAKLLSWNVEEASGSTGTIHLRMGRKNAAGTWAYIMLENQISDIDLVLVATLQSGDKLEVITEATGNAYFNSLISIEEYGPEPETNVLTGTGGVVL